METGTIIALATLGLGLIGALVTVVLRFGKVEAASELARQALAKAEAAEADLAKFQVMVARDYATTNMVAQVEKGVVDAVNRLGDRLDRILDGRTATRTTRATK